jgi:hypothetical protein
MLGAIAGDIIGSIYEHRPIKTTRFPLFHPLCRFTDDTVLTVALADSILHDTPYVDLLKRYYRAYPRAGYGGSFHQWAQSERSDPYNSWGNGSAMRVSPIGFAYPTLEDVLEQAKKSAEVTHDHPEGIKGAQAVASAVFLARTRKSKEQIKCKRTVVPVPSAGRRTARGPAVAGPSPWPGPRLSNRQRADRPCASRGVNPRSCQPQAPAPDTGGRRQGTSPEPEVFPHAERASGPSALPGRRATPLAPRLLPRCLLTRLVEAMLQNVLRVAGCPPVGE